MSKWVLVVVRMRRSTQASLIFSSLMFCLRRFVLGEKSCGWQTDRQENERHSSALRGLSNFNNNNNNNNKQQNTTSTNGRFWFLCSWWTRTSACEGLYLPSLPCPSVAFFITFFFFFFEIHHRLLAFPIRVCVCANFYYFCYYYFLETSCPRVSNITLFSSTSVDAAGKKKSSERERNFFPPNICLLACLDHFAQSVCVRGRRSPSATFVCLGCECPDKHWHDSVRVVSRCAE